MRMASRPLRPLRQARLCGYPRRTEFPVSPEAKYQLRTPVRLPPPPMVQVDVSPSLEVPHPPEHSNTQWLMRVIRPTSPMYPHMTIKLNPPHPPRLHHSTILLLLFATRLRINLPHIAQITALHLSANSLLPVWPVNPPWVVVIISILWLSHPSLPFEMSQTSFNPHPRLRQ